MWRHSASVATLGHFVVGNILGRIAGPNLARGPRQPRRDGREGYVAMIAKIEVERFSLTSSRPFDEVLAAIKGAVGNPNMVDFAKNDVGRTDVCGTRERSAQGARQDRPDALHGTRPWGRYSQSDGPRYAAHGPPHHRQSAHHAGNGKARSGRRLLRSRHRTRRRTP